MKLSTRTLASLMLVTTVAAAVPGASRVLHKSHHKESKFDRIMQHHDRKGELRADVLGMSPLEFRNALKRTSFTALMHRQGFKNQRVFRLALLGKLKNELRSRGWSREKIDSFVVTRSGRM